MYSECSSALNFNFQTQNTLDKQKDIAFYVYSFFLLSRGFLFIVYSNILRLKFVYILIVIYNHSRVQLRSSHVNNQNKAHMIVPQTCRLHFIYALMIACLTMFHKKKKRKQISPPFLRSIKRGNHMLSHPFSQSQRKIIASNDGPCLVPCARECQETLTANYGVK